MALIRALTSGGGGGLSVEEFATALENGALQTSSSSGAISGFTVGKSYFVCYTRGNSSEHGVSSGGTELGSYSYSRTIGSTPTKFYVGIITATSATITFLGTNNPIYMAQLD